MTRRGVLGRLTGALVAGLAAWKALPEPKLPAHQPIGQGCPLCGDFMKRSQDKSSLSLHWWCPNLSCPFVRATFIPGA